MFYLPFEIPGTQVAATLPPFGIFIEDEFENEGNGPGSILRHEIIHWQQYKRMGLIKFHYNYLTLYIKYGRVNNWMESEARRLSK